MENKETLSKRIEDTPKLRFPEFKDKWKQFKFGDNFILSQGLQVPVNKQFYEPDFNLERFIRIVDVTQLNEPQRYVYNPTGKGRVQDDDIFFVRYGAVGTIGYGYNGVIANNLFKVTPTFQASSSFLYQQFANGRFNLKLKELSASTSMPAINFTALNNLYFWKTNIIEQNKIGNFFSVIDKQIEQQENLLTLLNKYKRGVLREIYSNIKEYDYVSLKEISIICNGYAFNAKDYKKEGLYNIITITNVQGNKYIDNLNKCNRIRSIPDNINSYQILNENDILISMTGNVGRVSLNKGNNNLLNQRVCKIDNISKNVNKEYLFQILRNNKFEEFMTNLGKGANQKNISKSDIENYMIKLPDLNIQNKIANILSTYDSLIDKEKQVLNLLQEIKSGLLQQMFI